MITLFVYEHVAQVLKIKNVSSFKMYGKFVESFCMKTQRNWTLKQKKRLAKEIYEYFFWNEEVGILSTDESDFIRTVYDIDKMIDKRITTI